MSAAAELTVFVLSFSLPVVASIVLSRRLEQSGAWLQIPASFLGIIAALGADAPEIASAVTALYAGNRDLGLGIVIGSNVFNLASLLGLSALVSGRVRVTRRTLLLNGSVAILVLALTAAHLFGFLPGVWAMSLIAAVMVPYVAVLAISRAALLRVAAHLGLGLEALATKADEDKDAQRAETAPRPSYADLLGIIPTLASIVLGSIGMVRTATVLGARWQWPSAITGVLILATLTGIPNIITAVDLAKRGRGSAVLSEALNSNTLNLIIGASLPAMIFGAGALSARIAAAIWILAGMTLLALGLSAFRGGLGRAGGALLITLYLGFVAFIILYR